MADVKPFHGYYPDPEYAHKVTSLPYDVMSSDEAREIAKDNPYSFLHVVKSEIDFPQDSKPESEEIYKKAANNLQDLIKKDVLVRSKKPSFYVYRQIMGNLSQTGIVGATSAQEYIEGKIKKHEYTRKEKEDDRAHHVDMLNANTGPGFLTYHHKPEIDNLVEQVKERTPDIDFTADDGVRHTLWLIDDDSEVNSLENYFKEVPAFYIADGHHRTAAAARYYEMKKAQNPNHTGDESYNYFLSVIVPDNQLQILDYNRVVKDLNGLSPKELKEKIKEKFDLAKLENISDPEEAKPTQRGEFAMYLDGEWYRMTIKPEYVDKEDPVKSLDVSILQNNVLNPLLGIDDPRTNKRIDFIGGIRGLKELVKRCNEDCRVAFALYPTGLDQLMKISDVGGVMPPKSTWFEPKLRSGMVVKIFE